MLSLLPLIVLLTLWFGWAFWKARRDIAREKASPGERWISEDSGGDDFGW